MEKTYRISPLRLWFVHLFLLMCLYGCILIEFTNLFLIVVTFMLFVLDGLLLFQYKVTLDDEKIAVQLCEIGNICLSRSFLFKDIKSVEVNGDPDVPWAFGLLQVEMKDKKNSSIIIYEGLEKPYQFLSEIKNKSTELYVIGPMLNRLIENRGSFKWEVFKITDGKSIVQGMILIIMLLILYWISAGV